MDLFHKPQDIVDGYMYFCLFFSVLAAWDFLKEKKYKKLNLYKSLVQFLVMIPLYSVLILILNLKVYHDISEQNKFIGSAIMFVLFLAYFKSFFVVMNWVMDKYFITWAEKKYPDYPY